MDQPKQNIDKILKDRFGSHAENPPAEIWESLEKRLTNGAAGKRGYSRWFWVAGLIVVLSLLVFFGVQPGNDVKKKTSKNSEERGVFGSVSKESEKEVNSGSELTSIKEEQEVSKDSIANIVQETKDTEQANKLPQNYIEKAVAGTGGDKDAGTGNGRKDAGTHTLNKAELAKTVQPKQENLSVQKDNPQEIRDRDIPLKENNSAENNTPQQHIGDTAMGGIQVVVNKIKSDTATDNKEKLLTDAESLSVNEFSGSAAKVP